MHPDFIDDLVAGHQKLIRDKIDAAKRKRRDPRPRYVYIGKDRFWYAKHHPKKKTISVFYMGARGFGRYQFPVIMGGSPSTYYVREGGTAANKEAASGPGSTASACMKPSVHNAETYAPGDWFYLCDDGGDIVEDELVPPTSGTAENPIEYHMEAGDDVVIDAANSGSPTLDFREVDYIEVYGDDRLEIISGASGDPCVRFDDSEGCLLENALVHGGIAAAITFQNTFGLDTKNNILRGVEVSGSTTEGVYLKNNHASATTVADNILEDCYIHHGGTMETIQNSHDSTPANAPTGTIIRDSIIEDGGDNGTCQLMQDVLMERCLFQNLTAGNYGVIMLDGGGVAIIRNCLIMAVDFNRANDCGGIFMGKTDNAIVQHNTIYGITNSGAGDGMAIRKTDLGSGGTIQWNSLSGCDDQMKFENAPTLASYNGVYGTASDQGDNPVTTDPQFLNVGTNFRLQSDSPLISAAVGSTLSQDLDKRPRNRGSVNDIGCYESLKGGPRRL